MEKITVLIADDNIDFVNVLESYCTLSTRFEVIATANDGEEAVRKIEELKPDIVLLDMILPVLDGIGVLEAVKKSNMENKPKTIVLSAISDDTITGNAMDLGASFYILKPLGVKLFLERLNSVADRPFNGFYPVTNEENKLISQKEINFGEVEIRNKANDFLLDIGVPRHLKGFNYLVHGIKFIINQEKNEKKTMKEIYFNIASNFDTSTDGVERALRTAISQTILNGNDALLSDKFGYTLQRKNGRIANSEFLAVVSDIVEKELSENYV